MLEYFIPGELPGGSLGPYSATDVASYQDIWEVATSVLDHCMRDNNQLGWASLGQKS